MDFETGSKLRYISETDQQESRVVEGVKRNRDYYITPQEYERAAAFGVNAQALNIRVRKYGWAKEKAITTPLRQKFEIPAELATVAEVNGIPKFRVYQRVTNSGWSIEDACTTPIYDRCSVIEKSRSACSRYSKEILEIAKSNGIPYSTFTGRVRAGWSVERACTEPSRKYKKGAWKWSN